MKEPSEKQLKILEFIRSFTQDKGYPPSVREIGAAVGLSSPSTVHAHLKKLDEYGLIQKEEHCTRSLTLKNRESKGIPILGKVTAGMPILAVEENEGYLKMNMEDERGRLFALRIQGNSMINAGILDGDFIVVRKQSFASDGQIVVAMIDDEATCKRLEKRDGHIWLMPENPSYFPIAGDNSIIIGVVIRVIRDYQV